MASASVWAAARSCSIATCSSGLWATPISPGPKVTTGMPAAWIQVESTEAPTTAGYYGDGGGIGVPRTASTAAATAPTIGSSRGVSNGGQS